MPKFCLFYASVSVNKGGADCPTALKLVAVQVLLEITAFLRETYPALPKSTRYAWLDTQRSYLM